MDERQILINEDEQIRKVKLKLAFQCAPVLMEQKIANLLIVENHLSCFAKEAVKQAVKEIEGQKEEIHIVFLYNDQLRSVFFLYRRNLLETYIRIGENKSFLMECGYMCRALKGDMALMKERFKRFRKTGQSFPHEMGLFLGYPLCDVKGFILHRGQNSLYTGYWKVYDNLPQAMRIFEQYEECRSILMKQIIYDMIS